MQTQVALVPLWVVERISDASALRHYAWLAGRYANGKRYAWPGEARLASDLGCSERTTQRAIRALREADALVIVRTRKEDGNYGRNHYFLPLDDPREDPIAALLHTSHLTGGADQQKQSESAGHNQPSDPSGGADGGQSDIFAGQSAGQPYDRCGGSEPYPVEPNPSNHASEASASGTNAGASRAGRGPGEDQSAAEEGLEGLGDDPSSSKLGFEEKINSNGNGQEQTPTPVGGSAGNERSRGNSGKVNGTKRSSSTLPPEQAEHVQRAVGEFVDAYRAAHASVEPSANLRGRAGREIRALIVAGNDPRRVVHAARMAGRAGYAAVEQQLARMTSTTGSSRPGRVSATELPVTDWKRFVQE